MPPKKRSQYSSLPFTAVFSEPEQEMVPSLPYKSHALEDGELWRAELEEEGYTVVAGVAGEQEVEKARKLLWDWLEGRQTGIKQSAPSSWTDRAWPDWPGPGGKKYGSCKSEGAAHQPAAWFLRGLPRLKSAFSRLWNTEDLLVSFDGIIVWRPWHGRPERRPGGSKLHCDQNPAGRPGFQCVQGMLPLYPVDGEVGGTVLVPGSHKEQATLLARHSGWAREPGRDFCVLGPGDPLQSRARLVPLHPGDLLLWDSRLVHAGSVGPGTAPNPGHLARASLCVCMGPRDLASPATLAARSAAVEEGWCYSHWPWEAKGTKGQLSDRGRSTFQPVELTEEQKRLI